MTSNKNSSITDFLRHTKSAYALPINSFNVSYVRRDDVLPIAFGKLIERQVHSLPVLCSSDEDLIDILYYMLSTYEQSLQPGEDSNDESLRKELFSEVRCADVVNFSGKNPLVVITGETNLLTSLKFMKEGNTHRLAVLRPDGNIIGVLSQLDVITWLKQSLHECDQLKQLLSNKISQLNLTREVITVSTAVPAKEAFYTIRDKGVSGVGVVNEKGNLVGTISAFDMKAIGFDSTLFKLLSLPLGKYMEQFLEPFPVVFASPNDTLEKVAELMTTNLIHRVYILENSKTLIGLISPIDIINIILSKTENE